MRGLIAVVAAGAAGAIALASWRDQRLAAQVGVLAEEVRALRAATQAGAGARAPDPVTLEARERELLANMIAARVAQAAPVSTAALVKAAEAPPPEDAAREPTDAQLAAGQQANQILEAALARKALSAEDVLELRRLSGQVDPAAWNELQSRIAVAINKEQLRPPAPAFGMP